MSKRATTFNEAVLVVGSLSALEKLHLMKRLASMLEDDLIVAAGESSDRFEERQPGRLTFAELAEWLESNPPKEVWGEIGDDEDAGDYVHRMRRQRTES